MSKQVGPLFGSWLASKGHTLGETSNNKLFIPILLRQIHTHESIGKIEIIYMIITYIFQNLKDKFISMKL